MQWVFVARLHVGAVNEKIQKLKVFEEKLGL